MHTTYIVIVTIIMIIIMIYMIYIYIYTWAWLPIRGGGEGRPPQQYTRCQRALQR